MKSLIISILMAFSASALAAPSGIDVRKVKGQFDRTCEALDDRLAAADSGYRRLISTPVITADAYADYLNVMVKTGDEMKYLAESRLNLSEAIERLENSEPKPDDIQELLDLKTYAAGKAKAITNRYEEARRNQALLAEKMKKQKESAGVRPPESQALNPQAIEREKRYQLQVIEKARAMGDREKEFNAIKQFSAMDPQKGNQMLNAFYDGLSSGDGAMAAGPVQSDSGSAESSGSSPAPGFQGEFSRPVFKPVGSAVPGIADYSLLADGAKTPGGDDRAFAISNDIKLSVWSAVNKFSPALAAPHLREMNLSIAAEAKTDWLETKQRGLLDSAVKARDASERARYVNAAENIEKLINGKGAVADSEGVEQRSAALGEWNTSVSRFMDNSQEGRTERSFVDKKAALDAGYAGLKTDIERAEWIKQHGAEYDDTGRKLADFYVNNPEYLSARKTEADAQSFMRSHMADFKDGAQFTSDELGLQLPPGQKVVISRNPEGALDGARGVSYTDDKGLAHFQSFDDQVRVNEVREPSGEKRVIEQRLSADGTVNVVERGPGGRLFRTEEHQPDGTVTLESYDDYGKAAASKVSKPDGSRIEAVVMEKEGVKRTIFTDARGGVTFLLESLSGKDGFPRQSGRIVDGRLVMDKMELNPWTIKTRTGDYDYVFETKIYGRSAGFEVDMEAIRRLPGDLRGSAMEAAASIMTGWNESQAGPLKQFIAQVNKQAGPNDQVNIVTGKDDKDNTVYQASILTPEGSLKQVLGQWTKLSKAESAGLSGDVGLDVSVRSSGNSAGISKVQYLKIFRYSGDNITDRYSADSRATGNWFTGYGAKQDNYIRRYNSDTMAEIKKIKTGTETLYSSPHILGQFGAATGTFGKGVVQLTGSAMAVIGAGTIGWADKNLQDEFVERAKANFYGNEVSRDFGKNFIGDYYQEGYERLGVKEDHNIQNVGKEMAAMGKPTLGAVLQGGVEFSNGIAYSVAVSPLGGPSLPVIASKFGTVGTVASKAYSSYTTVRSFYKTGATGVEFVQAYRAFDENSPESKERYYAAVTKLTSTALKSPRTLSGAFMLAKNVREVKNVFAGKEQSAILGPDGRPYQKPPEELSSFNKFMTWKTSPGVLTRIMTADITRGADPSININLANNPASNAINSMEKWASVKVDKWLGKPAEMPRPELILPGQVKPDPNIRLVIPGQPEPKPDAKIITNAASGAAGGLAKNVKIWTPGQSTFNPDAKVFVPGAPTYNPDAEVILSGR